MNLFDELDKMRGKSEREKRKFAVMGAFGFTFVMFAGWLLYMTSGAAFDDNKNTASPFDALTSVTADAGKFIKGITSSVGETKFVIENLAAVAATTTATSTETTEETIEGEN